MFDRSHGSSSSILWSLDNHRHIVDYIVHESVVKITQRLLRLKINEIEFATGKRPKAPYKNKQNL